MRGENKLLLIVPEQFSFASERRILQDLPAKEAQNIEVLSFTRLSDYVGRSLGGLSGVFAEDDTKIIIMLRALEGLKDNLELYSKHSKSVSLAKQLIVLISEFKRECVTPELLEEASKLTTIDTLSKKLHELSLIYKAYDALFTISYIDDDTILDKLSEKLENNNMFDGYTICIDAFKGFTKQEYRIIKHLLKQAENVYISPCTNDIYLKDPAMITKSVNNMAKNVINIAEKENIKINILNREDLGIIQGARFKSEALKFLEEKIFYPTDDQFQEKTEDICLFTAQSIYDECDYIAATVRHLTREKNIRLRDIAVISRDEDNYKRELAAAFARYDIPIFEDSRQPISSQPLIALVKSILLITVFGFTTENVLNYLKTGLSPLTTEQVSKLENYALMWSIKGNAWKNDFTLSPNGLDSKTEKDIKDIAYFNELRKKAIDPLVIFEKRVKPKDGTLVSAEDISVAIFDFLNTIHVQATLKDIAIAFNKDGFTSLAEEQNTIWDYLMDILSKLASVEGHVATNLDTYFNLFSSIVSIATFGNIPHGLDEVTIGAADRIRLSSPEVVFVVGCAEGIFPRALSTSGLLTASDRRVLQNELKIELSNDEQLAACEERFIAYTAIAAARSKLYVSYHKTEGAGESLLPSIIWNNIVELFPQFDEKKEGHSVLDVSLLDASYYAETEKSAFAAFAKSFSISNNSKTASAIRSVLEKDETYKGKFESIDNSLERRPIKIKDKELATKLFKKDIGLSASRIDVYHKCPFQYFCKYGIYATPRKKASLDAMTSGTVIHYVLEQIIKEHKKDGLLSLTEQERRETVDKWLLTYLNETMGGEADKTNRFVYLYNRLKTSLYDVVDRLCREFEVIQFEPVDFELKIGAKEGEDGIKSYTIPLEDGGTVEITGSVDRVDKYEKDGISYIRIIDYKSGGKEFKLKDIISGLNMQMLIYLFAIEANGSERYGNVSPAGILYYPAKKIAAGTKKKHATPEEIADGIDRKDRQNGIIVSDELLIQANGGDNLSDFIKVKGKQYKYDHLVNMEEIKLIHKKIDEVIAEMGKNLHEGNIHAYPIVDGDTLEGCKYCDYASVCRFEDGDEINKMPEISTKNEAIEILSEIGGAEDGRT